MDFKQQAYDRLIDAADLYRERLRNEGRKCPTCGRFFLGSLCFSKHNPRSWLKPKAGAK